MQLSNDFERLFPNATNNFYQEFPLLHDQLTPFLMKVKKSDKNEARYELYKKSPKGNEIKNLLLVYFLPLLVKTDYKLKGSNWRPSVTDAQKFFLTEVLVSNT